MLTITNSKVVGSAAALVAFFLVSQANAYTYLSCNGSPILAKYIPYSTVLNTCSMPWESDQTDAYFHSIAEYWNAGEAVQHYGYWGADRCYITHGDGWWDVALVPREDIGGAQGLTAVMRSTCVLSSSIEEADVMIANDLPFSNPDEAFLAYYDGRTAMLHEFGHAPVRLG
jgi:hypothetical protein